ncbi:hypothetical protein CISIN_1g033153mg [Citrus sinensis]|uniref:Uncharacterized protein n=1 Tax=Citrus sinensis TaxID=2711 RepID=A0A067D4C6_CITSI|nr:hypothetical protein CISIN_1g033153mg [Citrus sinensis]
MPWLETNLTDDSRRILNTFVTIKGTILTNYTITKFIPITSSMSRVVLVGIVVIPVIPIRPVSPSLASSSATIISIPICILVPITITTSVITTRFLIRSSLSYIGSIIQLSFFIGTLLITLNSSFMS